VPATTKIPEGNRLAALQKQYAAIAGNLRGHFGIPTWIHRYPPVDELVDCILSQSTNDANRDKGFAALKANFPNWEAVRDADPAKVIEAIRPAGLANQKGPRIQNALRHISEARGSITLDFLADMPVHEAKIWLTSIDGVGPKTAAIVLCFAFNKAAFPVDTHIHRVTGRLGLIPEKMSADAAHDVLEAIIPPEDYYPGHLNIIRLGREICTARVAHCESCPLTAHCAYFVALKTGQKAAKNKTSAVKKDAHNKVDKATLAVSKKRPTQ
jgi:endonuclease III